MAESPEEPLQRALDSVDRLRTRLLWAVGSVTIFVAGTMAFFLHGAPVGSAMVLVHEIFILLLLGIVLSTLVVCLHVTRMARKILRAIETLGRR
jgi:hypothetical protein